MIPTDLTQPGLDRIVPNDSDIEQIVGGLLFGEGPVWHATERALYFVDILGDTIWRWTSDSGQEVVMRPSGRANGMTLDDAQRLLVAGWSSRTIWRMEPDGSTTVITADEGGIPLNSPNDIVRKSDGAIYWTDPSGALFIPGMTGSNVQRYRDDHPVYRRSPEGDVTVAIAESPYPNGLAFNTDETILYIADTVARQVIAHDVAEDGTVDPTGRVFYDLVGTEEGVADGMKVDVEDNVYVTGPAGVHIIDKDGKLLGRMLFGSEHCTNMAWGDEDWQSLFVTTFKGVYRLRLGIPGVPVGAGARSGS